MRNLINACVLILAVTVLNAQAPVRQFPDVAGPAGASGVASLGWVSTTEGFIKQDGTDIQNLQAAVGSSTIGNAALDARMSKLEALALPLPIPPTTSADLTTFPVGPLTDIQQNIQFGVGMWNATAQGVQPAVLSAARSIALPLNHTLLSVTLESLTTNVTVQFIATSGETVTVSLIPGNIMTVNTGWTLVSGVITVKMTAGPATDLRLRALSYR